MHFSYRIRRIVLIFVFDTIDNSRLTRILRTHVRGRGRKLAYHSVARWISILEYVPVVLAVQSSTWMYMTHAQARRNTMCMSLLLERFVIRFRRNMSAWHRLLREILYVSCLARIHSKCRDKLDVCAMHVLFSNSRAKKYFFFFFTTFQFSVEQSIIISRNRITNEFYLKKISI